MTTQSTLLVLVSLMAACGPGAAIGSPSSHDSSAYGPPQACETNDDCGYEPDAICDTRTASGGIAGTGLCYPVSFSVLFDAADTKAENAPAHPDTCATNADCGDNAYQYCNNGYCFWSGNQPKTVEDLYTCQTDYDCNFELDLSGVICGMNGTCIIGCHWKSDCNVGAGESCHSNSDGFAPLPGQSVNEDTDGWCG